MRTLTIRDLSATQIDAFGSLFPRLHMAGLVAERDAIRAEQIRVLTEGTDGPDCALSARPLVSGTADALAATTQATVGVLTGHTNGCLCTGCEHLRLVGLPDAVQALVSGTANRDDVARWLAVQFAPAGEGRTSRWWETKADELLALLGGDQDDDHVTVRLPAEEVAFIRGFHADRDRTATRADMVRAIEHLQAALGGAS